MHTVHGAAALRIYNVYFQKTFQTEQGCPWFHSVVSFLPEKLVVEKRTRKYAFQQTGG